MKFEIYKPGDGYDYLIFYGIPENWPNLDVLVVSVVRMGIGYVGFINRKDFEQQNKLEVQQHLLDVYNWPLDIAVVIWRFLNDKATMQPCSRWQLFFTDIGKQNFFGDEIVHIQGPEEFEFPETSKDI